MDARERASRPVLIATNLRGARVWPAARAAMGPDTAADEPAALLERAGQRTGREIQSVLLWRGFAATAMAMLPALAEHPGLAALQGLA